MTENRDLGEQSAGEQNLGGYVSFEFLEVVKLMTMLGHLEKRAGDAAHQLDGTGGNPDIVREIYDVGHVCGLLAERLDRFAVCNLLDCPAA